MTIFPNPLIHFVVQLLRSSVLPVSDLPFAEEVADHVVSAEALVARFHLLEARMLSYTVGRL